MKQLILIFLLLVKVSILASASILVPLSIEEMVKRSDWIVHGTVIGQKCCTDAEGHIFTQVELGIYDVWKGKVIANPIVIIHSGGVRNGRMSLPDKQVQYKQGEEVVAFLVLNSKEEAVTLGMSQGKFSVWQEQNSGDKFVYNPFLGVSQATAKSQQLNDTVAPRQMKLSDLKKQVKGGLR